MIDRIGETVKGHVTEAKLSPLEDLIRQYILREFAKNGQAPTAGEIAAGLTRRMINGIEKGGSGFSNLQRLTIAGHEVFRVDGPDGEHFFYTSREQRERVVWLTVEAADALPILEQVVKNF